VIYATTEKVVAAWLTSLPGITTAMVDFQLPEPDDAGNVSWASTGFITPYGVGGKPDIYVPVARPVVGVKCWFVDPNTGRPPWQKAANLAETVRAGCFTDPGEVFLTLPTATQNARLMQVYMLTEPRRTFNDTGDYACVDLELQMHWCVAN
jgi:hypothetical protein